jgi:hypothetical protein
MARTHADYLTFTNEKRVPHFNDQDPEYGDSYEMTNRMRAEWAAHAVSRYARAVGQEHDGEVTEEIETTVGDLLADLRHFCDGHGVDFDAMLQRANGNYAIDTDPKKWSGMKKDEIARMTRDAQRETTRSRRPNADPTDQDPGDKETAHG